jgi:hypothetical protein
MRLFSVMGAYQLIANNVLVHFSMFVVLAFFKYSHNGVFEYPLHQQDVLSGVLTS